MVTYTFKQEVRASNPGAGPPKFGAHTFPSRLNVSRVPLKETLFTKAEHPPA